MGGTSQPWSLLLLQIEMALKGSLTNRLYFPIHNFITMSTNNVTQVLPNLQKKPTTPAPATNDSSRLIRDAAMGVAGVAVGVGSTAFAINNSTSTDEQPPQAEVVNADFANAEVFVPLAESEEEITHEAATMQQAQLPALEIAPDPNEVMLTTAGGAHVAQVSDELPFAQAFAEARAQVGAGGLFEYRGQLYNTYYKSEWIEMSATDKQEYYATVGMSSSNESHLAQNATTPGSDELYVLGMGTTEIEGQEVGMAGMLINGQEVLLVDVDMDGQFDLLLADANNDGQYSADEVHDISEANLTTMDLYEAMEAQGLNDLASDSVADSIENSASTFYM